MKLYGYWRSSASWRVRIGLGLKGLPYEYVAVHLKDGVQHSDAHRARSPMAQIPVLEWDEGGATRRLTQSLAILEYLDETHPEPPLLPNDPHPKGQMEGATTLYSLTTALIVFTSQILISGEILVA